MKRTLLNGCLLLAVAAAAFQGAHADEQRTQPGGELRKPLSKPVKNLLPGTWNVQVVLDEKALRKQFDAGNVPAEKQDAVVGQLKRWLAMINMQSTINADGTSGSTTSVSDGKGGSRQQKETSRWKVVSIKGRNAAITLTGVTGRRAGKTRTIRITFLNDNLFRLDDDPALKDVPLQPPLFRRAKPTKSAKSNGDSRRR